MDAAGKSSFCNTIFLLGCFLDVIKNGLKFRWLVLLPLIKRFFPQGHFSACWGCGTTRNGCGLMANVNRNVGPVNRKSLMILSGHKVSFRC